VPAQVAIDRNVTVVYNPASGSAGDTGELRAAFGGAEHHGRIRWAPTSEADPGLGQAREALERGSHTVVACGGDGTVRAVAECLAGSDTVLGVVPLGTGNLLASNLGIPIGLDAVPTALSASVKVLDVGSVNDEAFTVMAGVGFDAVMIRDADAGIKRRFGSLAYVLSGARHLPARLFRATVTIDDEAVWSGRTAMVLVGNCGSVTGGLEVFPDAAPDDGVLDVAVLTAQRARDWLRVMWRLVRHKPQPPTLVRRFRGASIEVRLDRSMAYELDGEDRPPTDRLAFTIAPGALQVNC
jgi:YegS/Rv2252/BmrU family lipid kinase